MQTYEDYRNTRSKVADALIGVEQQLTLLGGKAKAEHISQARERLMQNDFRIILCGEFKRGKSTLVNAMLGEKVLPMKVAPCTGVITEVKYDGLPRVQVHPVEGAPFDAPIDDLKGHISIVDEEAPPVKKVVVYYPIDLCRNAVTLIDSPGLNEDWRRTQLSLQELSKSDAAIMVLSCEMALSRSEVDFIQSQLSERKFGIFFVWNRFDAVWNQHEEIATLRELSQNKLEAISSNIHYLSAREALVSHRKKDNSRLEKSNLPSFMDSLEEFLATKRGRTKLMVPLQQGIEGASYGLETLAPRVEQLMTSSLEELEATEKNLIPRLHELEKQRQHINEAIQESVDDLINDLIICFDQFLANIADLAFEESEAIRFPPDINRQERQDILIRWFRSWLKEKLDSLAKDVMEPILKRGINELKEELQSKRAMFHADIHALLNIDSEIELPSSPIFESEWLSELPLFISTAIALVILGASSGTIAISLLGLGALRAWLAGENLDQTERRKLANALASAMQDRRKEIIKLLRDNIEQSYAEIQQNIDDEMSQMISDTKAQLLAAVEARKNGEAVAKEHLNNITSSKNELKRLLTQLKEICQDD